MDEYKAVIVDRRALIPRKKWYLECHSNSEFPGGTQVNPFPRERTNFMRKQKGFSLIELLIVVAIILIIAAIAIPNLLRSRIAANEASAVGSIRTLNTAEVTYASTYPDQGFTCSLTRMGPPSGSASATSTTAGLVDAVLASGVKSGYTFAFTGCTAAGSTTL